MWLKINRQDKSSLLSQVSNQLRDKILSKELKPGTRLPASRVLADSLKVSRNIILQAYDILISEGYLETKTGSGTFVAQEAYLEKYKSRLDFKNVTKKLSTKKTSKSKEIIDFEIGIPDFSLTPRNILAKLLKDAQLNATERDLSYGEKKGVTSLRKAVADYLVKSKGILCSTEQIFIVSGSAQAFEILSGLFRKNNRHAIVEDPSYTGIHQILKNKNIKITTAPVDKDGIIVNKLPSKTNAKFIIATPSHQFPTGAIMPIQRRIQLIKYAQKNDLYIIENDYDSEFRYSANPVSSLQLLDNNRVIHLGTFSETIYPSFRMSYMVFPLSLLANAEKHISRFSITTPAIMQIALSKFISQGYLERHIHKSKKIYQIKRDLLIQQLQDNFKDKIIISGESTGLFLVVEFINFIFDRDIINNLKTKGVRIILIKDQVIKTKQHLNKVILGYSHLTEHEIIKGVKLLKLVLKI